MLAGVLQHIEDDGVGENRHVKRLEHMRFIDLKATPGTAQAKTNEVRDYIEILQKIKKVSKYFNDP